MSGETFTTKKPTDNELQQDLRTIQLTLMDLNEHCLIRIIEQLEQIRLGQASRQLQKLIEHIWQRRCYIMVLDGFHRLYQSNIVLKEVFEHISSFIVQLKIEHLEARRFSLLTEILFSNCRELILTDWHHDFRDEDIRHLDKMFPKLRSFTPKTPFIDGANISCLQQLEKLDLSYCQGLNPQYLPSIFRTLPLKVFKMRFNSYDAIFGQNYELHIGCILKCLTLQEIELDDFLLAVLSANNQLQQLTNLIHIKCYVRDYLPLILIDLEKYQAKNIQELTALEDSNTLQVLRSLSVGGYVNLTKLTLVNSCLLKLPHVKSLKELHLIGCNLQQVLLLSYIRSAINLKVLNITSSKGLDADFLWHLVAILHESSRAESLVLFIKNSSLDASLLNHHEVARNSHLLRLNLDVLELNLEMNHFGFVLKH